ncbi:hypothetical protein Tco_0418390, partial [Tanacetum coccineum]
KKPSKDVESSRDPKSKESKSSSSSKCISRSQHKSAGKSAHVEEPSYTVDDSGVQQNQEFDTSNNDEQSDVEATSRNILFKQPEKPPTLDPDWNKTKHVDFRPPQTWINLLVGLAFNLLKGICKSHTELEYHFEECFKATTERLDWHNLEGKQYPFDLRKPLPLIPDRRGHQVIPQDYFINNDLEYLKVTSLKIMKWYDYGHLDEIEVRRKDHQLYKFKEYDFPRLRLQDIEDMLLLLVQQKLTNLTIDERYDLNVELRMFTKHIGIQRRVEYLQLGVESYQKKLNLTKLDTIRPDLKKRTAFTAYSDPRGVIYVDQNNKNRLMRTDELHKFSDGRSILYKVVKIRYSFPRSSQNWRDLPRDNPLVRIEVLRSVLTDSKIYIKMDVEVSGSSRLKDS